MSVVYRDARGVEYVSVPLPTHEVTEAVPIDARRVRRRSPRGEVRFYVGTDAAELAVQPRSHRKRWSDEQWIAFKEHQHNESELARTDVPVAAAIVVKMR